MRYAVVLFCAVCYILTLIGCESPPSPPQLTAVDVSQETSDTLAELGAESIDYQYYDYQVDDEIQGLILRIYILGEDHQWVLGDSLTIDRDQRFPSHGQLNVRIDGNEAVILSGPGSSQTYSIPPSFQEARQGFTGTSWLHGWEIVPDQETQLMLRTYFTNSETGMPPNSEFLDTDMSPYSAAIGVTVTFISGNPSTDEHGAPLSDAD